MYVFGVTPPQHQISKRKIANPTHFLKCSPRIGMLVQDVNSPTHFIFFMLPATFSESMDTEKMQARHYQTLKELLKSKNPNKAAVAQLLELEFQARRCFIDSDLGKQQERPVKILEAYPCFEDLDHVSILIWSAAWLHLGFRKYF